MRAQEAAREDVLDCVILITLLWLKINYKSKEIIKNNLFSLIDMMFLLENTMIM